MSRWPAAAFLDRDGTINVKAPEGDYIDSPLRVELMEGAADAIRRLNETGVPVLVVTNQRGIALGRMSEADLARVHERLADLLAEGDARVDGWYHCPHDKGVCECRKPGVAMLERAAAEHGIARLDRTVIAGDSEADVEAGRRVGATTVRIAGNGDPARVGTTAASAVVASLDEAVAWILRAS